MELRGNSDGVSFRVLNKLNTGAFVVLALVLCAPSLAMAQCAHVGSSGGGGGATSTQHSVQSSTSGGQSRSGVSSCSAGGTAISGNASGNVHFNAKHTKSAEAHKVNSPKSKS